ncbi:uncharacterized protein RHIMIDRAFT_259706 [Rhizopus microsporus ATCC 52813]|uniref:Uncharacterized protein n=1 Tax=Rhizopus microsporus ATCC 52813 TaxID=1340429 RepID=A0A2G4SPN4_RHIZD|nr:uncharacterized protein RHIMIDRAFT_259706 [Rhizopus microsporus ATCC 52813]PHZ10731.1 hypothetical protein RHIMIDRAFT_259706 [Rhizopus microsporus ATCC 52813]
MHNTEANDKDDHYLGALWTITVNHFGYTCICLLQVSIYFQNKIVTNLVFRLRESMLIIYRIGQY